MHTCAFICRTKRRYTCRFVTCGSVTCGFVTCGSVTCGFVTCGSVTCGFVTCGSVTCGFVTCGSVTCGFVTCGFVTCGLHGKSVRMFLDKCTSHVKVSFHGKQTSRNTHHHSSHSYT